MAGAYTFPPGAAIVVGGSGGVGQAIARAFARYGCPIAMTYRSNPAAAEGLVNELQRQGHTAACFALDLLNPPMIQSTLAAIDRDFGHIHTVINATGSDIRMRYLSELTPDNWQQIIDADLNGFFDLLHATLPYLKRNGGSIVQISSIGLQRWPKRDGLSVIPKAGIESLLRGIAREEGRFGIRANSIQLGVIDAGLFHRLRGIDFDEQWLAAARENTALKRFGEADEVAEAAAFLASDQAAYITGQCIKLDGGYSL